MCGSGLKPRPASNGSSCRSMSRTTDTIALEAEAHVTARVCRAKLRHLNATAKSYSEGDSLHSHAQFLKPKQLQMSASSQQQSQRAHLVATYNSAYAHGKDQKHQRRSAHRWRPARHDSLVGTQGCDQDNLRGTIVDLHRDVVTGAKGTESHSQIAKSANVILTTKRLCPNSKPSTSPVFATLPR